MDFSLAALKLSCGALKDAVQAPATTPPPPSASSSSPASAPSTSASTLFGILFQRAWLQGVLVSAAEEGEGRSFVLDDGTGLVELCLTKEILQHEQLAAGMYVMVVGQFLPGAGDLPLIKVHKVVDLSPNPDSEAIWYLEVIEAYRLFYQSPLED
ncbi:hypothetical protein Taro_015805 [Colocasia esculenta]|uniref:RecQ-mediated genome instability protein 2 n=1 Tax=Colocasia esculenta TaxID=4460 RepID=A0A843UM66_COLES|nr:hypothetical protein [Colocasia esculenta]